MPASAFFEENVPAAIAPSVVALDLFRVPSTLASLASPPLLSLRLSTKTTSSRARAFHCPPSLPLCKSRTVPLPPNRTRLDSPALPSAADLAPVTKTQPPAAPVPPPPQPQPPMSVQMTDADTPRPDEAPAASASAAATPAAATSAAAGPNAAATSDTPTAPASTDAESSSSSSSDGPAAATAVVSTAAIADSGSVPSGTAPAAASDSTSSSSSSSSSCSSGDHTSAGVPMSDSSSSSDDVDSPSASSGPPAAAAAPAPATLSDLLRAAVSAMFTGPPAASVATVSASVKAIAKLITAIAARPGDKKLRQHRLDNIVIKKQIAGVPGALGLCRVLGFQEVTIDGKPYISVDETDPVIAQYAEAAEVIVAAAAAPAAAIDDAASHAATAAGTAVVTAAVERQRCVKNCGFFGSPHTENMCSLCYSTHVSKAAKPATAAGGDAVSRSLRNLTSTGAAAAAATAATTTAQQRSQSAKRTPRERLRYAFVKTQALCRFNRCRRPVQVHRDRCFTCDRKLNLAGIECRCGYVFCGRHRYADEHDCRYDHQRRHQSALAKVNQKVQGSKLEKITDD